VGFLLEIEHERNLNKLETKSYESLCVEPSGTNTLTRQTMKFMCDKFPEMSVYDMFVAIKQRWNEKYPQYKQQELTTNPEFKKIQAPKADADVPKPKL
jgi:hypothetical protein